MESIFYLSQESFDEDQMSSHDLYQSIGYLYTEFMDAISHGSIIKVCSDIYDKWKWKSHPIGEIWQPDCELDGDLKSMILQMIYDRAESVETVSNAIDLGDSDSLNVGLLTLKPRKSKPQHLQLYAGKTWYAYIKDCILRMPLTSDEFIDSCNQYMDNLYIIDRNKESIKQIYKDFKVTILYHLNALNVYLVKQRDLGLRRDILLKTISQLANLPEVASLEGDAHRKSDFTFSFYYPVNGAQYNLCFEPHMKLCHSDKYPGDSEYYFYRIYFYEGNDKLCDGKVVIGHIGDHL